MKYLVSGVLVSALAIMAHGDALGYGYLNERWDISSNVVVGCKGPTAYLWNAHTGKIQKRIQEHLEPILSVHLNPAGDRLLTCSHKAFNEIPMESKDTSVRLWDVPSGKLRARFEGQITAKFSPDGSTIATISLPRPEERGQAFASIWSGRQGKLLTSVAIGDFNGQYDSLAWMPDSRHFMVIRSSEAILISLDKTASEKYISFQRQVMQGFDLAPNSGQLMTFNSEDAFIWDLSSGKLVRKFHVPVRQSATDNAAPNVFWSQSGRQIFVIQEDALTVWNSVTGSQMGKHLQPGAIESVITDPGRTRAVLEWHEANLSTAPSGFTLWDLLRGKAVRTEKYSTEGRESFHFSPSGLLLLKASEDLATVLDLKKKELITMESMPAR